MSLILYSINDFNTITDQGFDFKMPQDTIKLINDLASQVGSPTYIKTPLFNKKESIVSTGGGIGGGGGGGTSIIKKKSKAIEIFGDEAWESVRNFQPTKLDQTDLVNEIRTILNKLTDKNYKEQVTNIIAKIDLAKDEEEFNKISICIFEIASNNRFYSKIYAELYTKLIKKYTIFMTTFNSSLSTFLELFNNIEYTDSSVDYDKFCKNNKDNEKRKALSAFFVNLTLNKIIPQDQLFEITCNLMTTLLTYITEPNKKNEVNEIADNIAILFEKALFENDKCLILINGQTIYEVISLLANSKQTASLSSKTIFKFMDLIDM
jgi:hypothetical protein